MSTNDLALFPLAAVLFPGGTLDLRIFEPRYLDLVRDCARNDSAFGVCLILGGLETGAAAVPAAVGTLARIIDFDSLPDGLLGIRVRGGERFRVGATRVRDNGLVLGSARLWPAEPRVALPPEYALLASILERLLERIGGEPARAERALYDDASWVGFRLAEHLPLARTEQQELLQLTDPLERLAWLTRELPRFQPD